MRHNIESVMRFTPCNGFGLKEVTSESREGFSEAAGNGRSWGLCSWGEIPRYQVEAKACCLSGKRETSPQRGGAPGNGSNVSRVA